MNDYNVVYLRKLRRKTNNKPVSEKHVVLLLFTSRAHHYVNNYASYVRNAISCVAAKNETWWNRNM